MTETSTTDPRHQSIFKSIAAFITRTARKQLPIKMHDVELNLHDPLHGLGMMVNEETESSNPAALQVPHPDQPLPLQ
ncbi:hypothetical protein [Microvirga sp. G4-2]|uniref:hypothetical protein n=1 Tax=Microvirga sp. G4-2 TaxID=3434467 RepID=UPI00404475D8